MRFSLNLVLLTTLIIGSCANSPSFDSEENWHCGEAFKVDLQSGESLVSFDDTPPGFSVYAFKSGAGGATIYEGNSPYGKGEPIRTGREQPSVVTVNGAPPVMKRIIVTQDLPDDCGAATAHRDL